VGIHGAHKNNLWENFYDSFGLSKARVTLLLMVEQSVILGVAPLLGLKIRF